MYTVPLPLLWLTIWSSLEAHRTSYGHVRCGTPWLRPRGCGLQRESGLATFPYALSAAFTGTRASNGHGILHILE